MRKVYFLSILASLVFVASGCHTNPASNPASDSHSAPAASNAPVSGEASASTAMVSKPEHSVDLRPVLVCFGDSLTAGLGTDQGQSYPDYLQADLDQLHYHYRVVNEGVSGDTTKDGVERLPEILALHPAVAVVEFGGNDGLR